MFFKYLSLSGLLMVASCHGQKKAAETRPPIDLVALQTGGCFGYCPVFKMQFKTDGQVLYSGYRFVYLEGDTSFVLQPEELSRLEKAVRATNLWQYPEVIATNIVDAPSVTLTVYSEEQSHSVRGSVDRPAPLRELEQLILDLGHAHGLELRKGKDPNEVPIRFKSTVVVLLDKDINAGNWIQQFSEVDLQLVRRTGLANEWIVAYDNRQLDEKGVISLLADMEGVLKVRTEK